MAKKMLAALVAALMLMMGLVPSVLNASTAAADSNSNFILHNNEQPAPESAAQENPDLPGSGANAPAVNFTNAAPLMDFSTPENGVMGALADDDPLKLSKTVTKNTDGTYTVHLEAYTTGEITTRKTPCDIVLVLDESGSMSFHFEVYAPLDTTQTYYAPVRDNNGNISWIDLHWHEFTSWGRTHWGWGYDAGGWSGWTEVKDPMTSPDDSDPNHMQFYDGTVKLDALKDAVTSFIENVREQTLGDDMLPGTEDDIKHRIAVVGFGAGTSGSAEQNYLSTELFVGSTRYNYGDKAKSTDGNTLANAKYGEALQEIYGDSSVGYDNIVASITALTAKMNPDALTFSNLGVEMADGILAAATPTYTGNPAVEDQRNKVVVMFTDGLPGYGECGWSSTNTTEINNICYNTATDAILNAYTLKHTYEATVYTIGMFTNANATPPAPSYHDGWAEIVTTIWGDQSLQFNDDLHSWAELYENANRYLHLVSSNYPEATGMKTPGTLNPILNEPAYQGSGYYLSASDSNALNAIFDSISSQINAGSEADETTEVRDVLSPYFQLPEGATESDITVKTAKAKSGAFSDPDDPSSWEDPETFTPPSGTNPQTNENYGVHIGEDPDGNAKVSVDGFDFMANFVSANGRDEDDPKQSGSFFGRKLIIEFDIVPKPGFLGGNDVPTNGAASGVYNPPGENGDLLGAFPNDNKFDIPIPDISVTVPDKNVYLYGALTEEQLKAGAIAIAGTGNNAITIKLDAQDFALEPWQYEFVTITPTVSPESFTALTEDKTYTVSVTIAPKDNTTGTVTEKSASATGKINVFKPELTFKDSEACYGGKAPADYSANLVKTEWKHGETVDTAVTMIGAAPTLDLTYTPEADCFQTVNGVNYIVTRDDIPVKVTVEIDAADATAHVKFIHQACTNETGCGWDNLNPTPTNGDPAFLLHVKTCTLTVGKQLTGKQKYQPGESFIFHISGDNPALPIEMEVVAHVDENGTVQSITINGLPVGTYTVTEDTGWSWRYEVTGENGVAVELKCEGDRTGTANFTNNLVSNKWLTWEAAVDNRWNSTGEIDKAILPKPEP